MTAPSGFYSHLPYRNMNSLPPTSNSPPRFSPATDVRVFPESRAREPPDYNQWMMNENMSGLQQVPRSFQVLSPSNPAPTTAISPAEINYDFDGVPSSIPSRHYMRGGNAMLPRPSVVSRPTTSTVHEKPKSLSLPAAKRKPIDGDCSICWDAFEADKNELTWCKTTCGNNFHKKCFVEWLVTPKEKRVGSDLKCPYCRGDWDACELLQLQQENGIVPPRPYKRARHEAAEFGRRTTEQRDFHRREARLRASMMRSSGGTSRAWPGSQRGVVTSQAHPLRSSPLPTTVMAEQLREMHRSQLLPAYQPAGTWTPNLQSQGPAVMNSPDGNQFMLQPRHGGLDANRQDNIRRQSHDLSAPGYSMSPTVSASPHYPSPMQRMSYPSFQMQPMQQSVPSIHRCPAMQAQMAPQAVNMGMQAQGVQFCPAMAEGYQFQRQYAFNSLQPYWFPNQFITPNFAAPE